MNKIGSISSEGTGGEVFSDDTGYYYIINGAIFSDGEFENLTSQDSAPVKSKTFSSLDELVSSLPMGVFFRRLGESPLDFHRRYLKEVIEKWND